MKFQVIAPDNKAAIDGEWFPVNLAAFGWHPAYHAVQFDGERGEVEWVAPLGGAKPANVRINRDQLTAMFGPLIEHTRTMLAAKHALEAAKAGGQ